MDGRGAGAGDLPMKAAVLNVYRWDAAAQNGVLVAAIGPLLAELRAAERIASFFFDRYDARGPHLFLALAWDAEREPRLAEAVAARLEAYLAEHPDPGGLSAEQLQARHESCRGRSQSALDLLPGIAERDTVASAVQPLTAYPFSLGRELEDPAPLWRAFTAQSAWAIGQIAAREGKTPQGAAIRLLATVDLCLRRRREREAFWRFYATTMLVGLEEKIAAEGAAATAEALAGSAVSAANREIFERVFAAVAQPGGATEEVAAWAELLLDGAGEGAERALRSLTHSALKQLGLLGAQEIPLVIFAWRRSFAAG